VHRDCKCIATRGSRDLNRPLISIRTLCGFRDAIEMPQDASVANENAGLKDRFWPWDRRDCAITAHYFEQPERPFRRRQGGALIVI
jgi:hypothetical protein